MCGGLSSPSPLCAIGTFLHTSIVDDVLPPSAFCALRCAFCPRWRYWLGFFYQRWSSGGSTKDCNNNNEGAMTRVPLPAPSREDDAAPPDHLLPSRFFWGGGIAMPALRSCRGIDDGKEEQWWCWECCRVFWGRTFTRWRGVALGVWVVGHGIAGAGGQWRQA